MRVKDAVGRFGEETAARHLQAAGLAIVERNWRAPRVPGRDLRGEHRIADVPGPQLRALWGLPSVLSRAPDRQLERGHLTVRGLDRVLRTAWTLADLAGEAAPQRCHVEQALTLRLTGSGW